ncbi:MAG: hypothetical protein ACOYK9_04640 [Chlamydiia bacterium]
MFSSLPLTLAQFVSSSYATYETHRPEIEANARMLGVALIVTSLALMILANLQTLKGLLMFFIGATLYKDSEAKTAEKERIKTAGQLDVALEAEGSLQSAKTEFETAKTEFVERIETLEETSDRLATRNEELERENVRLIETSRRLHNQVFELENATTISIEQTAHLSRLRLQIEDATRKLEEIQQEQRAIQDEDRLLQREQRAIQGEHRNLLTGMQNVFEVGRELLGAAASLDRRQIEDLTPTNRLLIKHPNLDPAISQA